MKPLIGVLGLDEDYAVRTANTVERQACGVFQHFDRGDIVGVDSHQTAARSGLDWEPVDHKERLRATIDSRCSTNSDGDSAVWSSRDHYARNTGLQGQFDRLSVILVDVFARYNCASQCARRGGIRHVIDGRPHITYAAKAEPDENSEQSYAWC